MEGGTGGRDWRRKPKGQTNFVVGQSVSQKNILPNAWKKVCQGTNKYCVGYDDRNKRPCKTIT